MATNQGSILWPVHTDVTRAVLYLLWDGFSGRRWVLFCYNCARRQPRIKLLQLKNFRLVTRVYKRSLIFFVVINVWFLIVVTVFVVIIVLFCIVRIIIVFFRFHLHVLISLQFLSYGHVAHSLQITGFTVLLLKDPGSFLSAPRLRGRGPAGYLSLPFHRRPKRWPSLFVASLRHRNLTRFAVSLWANKHVSKRYLIYLCFTFS